MNSLFGFAGQGLFFAIAAAITGYLSATPVYHQVPDGMAQIKLLIKHGGVRVEDCRRLTTEELAKLPSTERRPIDCSRERSPVEIELVVDGDAGLRALQLPAGEAVIDFPVQKRSKIVE